MSMKKAICTISLLVSTGVLGGTVVPDGKTLNVTLSGGETFQLDSTCCDALNKNTYDDVVVGGSGTLTVAKVFASYAGAIHIGAGATLLENVNWGLGQKAKCTVYVASGATLDISIPSSRQIWHKTVLAEGASFNMNMASIFVYGELALDGDVTLGGAEKPSFYGRMSMNGHRLIAPYGITSFNPSSTDGSGEVHLSKSGTTVYGPFSTDHFGTNFTFHVAGNTTYRYQTSTVGMLAGDYTNRCEWTLKCDGDMTFQANFGDSAYHGPIIMPEDAKLTVASDGFVDKVVLEGPVSCGTLSLANSRNGFALVLSATNQIGRIDKFSTAIIWAQHRQSLPDDLADISLPVDTSGKFTSPYGLVIAGTTESTAGWTGDEAMELFDHFKLADTNWIGVGAMPGERSNITIGDFDLNDYTFRFGAWGGGTARLTGNFTSDSRWYVHGMSSDTVLELAMSPEIARTFWISHRAGRLSFADAGRIELKTESNGELQLGNDANVAFPAVLVIGSNTQATVAGHMRVGAANSILAAVELLDGGTITNSSQVMIPNSHISATSGAFIRGGEWKSGAQMTVAYYSDCLGYMEVSGGRLIESSFKLGGLAMGAGQGNDPQASIGQLYVKGGEIVHDATSYLSYFSIGAGSTGVYYQVAGKATFGEGFGVPRSCGSESEMYGNGTLTLAGGTMTCEQEVRLADRYRSRGQINLNGGVLEATQISRTAGTVKQGKLSTYEGGAFNTTADVTFNGGTLKAHAAGKRLLGQGAAVPDNVVVFAGGAAVDTAGFDVSIDTPLAAPTGSGISSIALPDDGAAISGYFVAPYVQIEGDGRGASAVADFDSTNGVVKGVVVTCPGWGYTTATAKLLWGQAGSRKIVSCDVALAANATTGGLVKKGAGTLTLSAVNTYGGATTVEEGTLKLGVANALPADAEIVCKGGALDVAAGVGYPSGISFDVSGLDPAAGSVILARNWTGDAPPIVTGVRPKTYVACSNGVVSYGPVRGFMIQFR